jgi:hypothetical protein
MVTKAGGHASYEHGCKLESRNSDISEYISKFGRLPHDLEKREAANAEGWNESHEVAKAVTKKARTRTGRTPFQLLQDYHDYGDENAGRLFQDYVAAFAGKRQIVWSNGLKDELLPEGWQDMTDEEVAAADEPVTVREIGRELWREVIRQRKRGAVLAAALDSKQALESLLQEVDRQCVEPPGFSVKNVVDDHYIWIRSTQDGHSYHIFDLSNQPLKRPDVESPIRFGTEAEAYFVACRIASHRYKLRTDDKR